MSTVFVTATTQAAHSRALLCPQDVPHPPVAVNTSPRGYPPAALALIVPEAEEPSPLLGEHPKGARLSTEDVLPTAFVPVAASRASSLALRVPAHWGCRGCREVRSRTPFARHRLREASEGYARLEKTTVGTTRKGTPTAADGLPTAFAYSSM